MIIVDFLYCLIAVAGLSVTVCAGPGPCRQTLLWSLDGQRWTAEADGENSIKDYELRSMTVIERSLNG